MRAESLMHRKNPKSLFEVPSDGVDRRYRRTPKRSAKEQNVFTAAVFSSLLLQLQQQQQRNPSSAGGGQLQSNCSSLLHPWIYPPSVAFRSVSFVPRPYSVMCRSVRFNFSQSRLLSQSLRNGSRVRTSIFRCRSRASF